MSKDTCFVVMGFGKKVDYYRRNNDGTAPIIDLDIVYENVIKPLFCEDEIGKEYILQRADNICYSGNIHKDMYQLLYSSDLVIADISALNSNAIYELGVRFAMRKKTTIVIMQRNNGMPPIPFDLSTQRIIQYEDLSEPSNLENLKRTLKSFIIAAKKSKNECDSPVYDYLPNLIQPEIKEEEKSNTVEDNITVFLLYKKAVNAKNNSNFYEAEKLWRAILEKVKFDEYIIQQIALASYKSKKPTVEAALQRGLDVINKLHPEYSRDIETLGIAGAIYKRLYLLDTNRKEYLDKAISMYKKGYVIQEDYYNGENYANCLLMKAISIKDDEEREFQRKCALKVYEEVYDLLIKIPQDKIKEHWIYATLCVCCYALNKEKEFILYKGAFLNHCNTNDWSVETFEDTISLINKIKADKK